MKPSFNSFIYIALLFFLFILTACPPPSDIDADMDGVSSMLDCDDENPLVPAPEGTPCDDEDPNTIGDSIQEDECSCSGTPNTSGPLNPTPESAFMINGKNYSLSKGFVVYDLFNESETLVVDPVVKDDGYFSFAVVLTTSSINYQPNSRGILGFDGLGSMIVIGVNTNNQDGKIDGVYSFDPPTVPITESLLENLYPVPTRTPILGVIPLIEKDVAPFNDLTIDFTLLANKGSITIEQVNDEFIISFELDTISDLNLSGSFKGELRKIKWE